MGWYPHPQELQPELPIAPHLPRGQRLGHAAAHLPAPLLRRAEALLGLRDRGLGRVALGGLACQGAAAQLVLGTMGEMKCTRNGGQIKRICGLSWIQISFLVMLGINNYSTTHHPSYSDDTAVLKAQHQLRSLKPSHSRGQPPMDLSANRCPKYSVWLFLKNIFIAI